MPPSGRVFDMIANSSRCGFNMRIVRDVLLSWHGPSFPGSAGSAWGRPTREALPRDLFRLCGTSHPHGRAVDEVRSQAEPGNETPDRLSSIAHRIAKQISAPAHGL